MSQLRLKTFDSVAKIPHSLNLFCCIFNSDESQPHFQRMTGDSLLRSVSYNRFIRLLSIINYYVKMNWLYIPTCEDICKRKRGRRTCLEGNGWNCWEWNGRAGNGI